MKLDEIVAWYQKKIGTYDKQQWEKTVEQKILDGFTSVTLKNAKLKTDLIDVDLVRGSTFPKAKPKQSLITVIRLAVLRYFFLPLYAQWWVTETSPNTFAILLLMYITQMITWAVYTFNVHRLSTIAMLAANNATHVQADNATVGVGVSDGKQLGEEHIVALSDLLIPMGLSLLLSFIHSQIVATNIASGVKSKHRRFSNTSQNGKPPREPRMRRRKKLARVRSQEFVDTTAQQSQLQHSQSLQQKQPRKLSSIKKLNSVTEKLTIPNKSVPQEHTTSQSHSGHKSAINQTVNKCSIALNESENCKNLETFNSTVTTTSAIRRRGYNNSAVASLKFDLNGATQSATNTDAIVMDVTDCCTDNHSATNSNLIHKKRNVNWHSPIHNFACGISTQEKQQQTSPQSMSSGSASATASAATTTTTSETNSPNMTVEDGTRQCLLPGGDSSGSSSRSGSGCVSGSPNKTVRIDDCVQEFYDDLISRTDQLAFRLPIKEGAAANSSAGEESANSAAQHMTRRNNCEDDGFESLNGKSSSGEETHPTVAPAYVPPTAIADENKLRLRLNTNLDKLRVEDSGGYEGEFKPNSTYRQKLKRADDELDNRPLSSCEMRTQIRKISPHTTADVSSGETDEEGDDGETISSPASLGNASNYNECTTSATEWLGVTTNSEEYSYSSEIDNSDDYKNNPMSDEDVYDEYFMPTTILNPHGTSDRISCTVWEQREIKKAQLSVLEISSCIIERVESMPETNDYIYIGLCFSFLLSLIPSFCRLCEVTIENSNASEINYLDLPMLLWEKASFSFSTVLRFAFGNTQWERTVLVISFLQRLCLTVILFIIFAVAERTFKQRFLYAKLFSHLTSSRRARKSNLPHFRLSKVRNIKTWLSVRSYLKKRGPQRSVNVIVSVAFIVTLLLLAFLSVEWLKDSVQMHSHLNLEALMWSTTIGIFLVRFMTLGNKIHHKYRSVSVLITEQINLYLQIEQKPKKKDELMVSNSVLKLASDLLKELETPFMISGLRANPYLFTTVKVVILSALSGVLSEMLGFKLKLHKIKIK